MWSGLVHLCFQQWHTEGLNTQLRVHTYVSKKSITATGFDLLLILNLHERMHILPQDINRTQFLFTGRSSVHVFYTYPETCCHFSVIHYYRLQYKWINSKISASFQAIIKFNCNDILIVISFLYIFYIKVI